MTTRRGMVRAALGGLLGGLFVRAQAAQSGPALTLPSVTEIASKDEIAYRMRYVQSAVYPRYYVPSWLGDGASWIEMDIAKSEAAARDVIARAMARK